MGELIPRSYLWLEKLVADKCKELRSGEKDGVDETTTSETSKSDLKDSPVGKEASKTKLKKEKEKERDSGGFSPTLEPLDGEDIKGKGIPTIPWSQFIKLGQICTIKVHISIFFFYFIVFTINQQFVG